MRFRDREEAARLLASRLGAYRGANPLVLGLVAAVGVAPTATLDRLRQEADEVVCGYWTEAFNAVGQLFADFSEVTDDMVVAALARTPQGSIAHQESGEVRM